MDDLLGAALNVAVPVFAISSMLSVGLTFTLRQITDPLRDVRLLVVALVANFVVVPLLAVGVVELLGLAAAYKVGLILVGSAAGAPFVIKMAQLAKGDLALASGLLVLLLILTIGYLPVVLPLALPDIEVDPVAIAASLTSTMLAPFVIGLVVHALWAPLAARVRPSLGPLSTTALVVLVSATFVLNLGEIIDVVGEGVILAALIILGGAFATGYLGGYLMRRPTTGRRGVLGLATGQRNIAAATVVATQNFDDSSVLVTVIVSSLVGLALLFPVSWALSRRERTGIARPAPRRAA